MGWFKKGWGKVKALLRNSMWCGSTNIAYTRVSWDDCTMPKKIGDVGLISPKDAMRLLMSKWNIQALLSDQSNLQILLRYHITL